MNYVELTHRVPEHFAEAAARYGMDAENLARLLCVDFFLDQPSVLVVEAEGVVHGQNGLHIRRIVPTVPVAHPGAGSQSQEPRL